MSSSLHNWFSEPVTPAQLALLSSWCRGTPLERCPSGNFLVGEGLEFWVLRRPHACPRAVAYYAGSDTPVARFVRKRGEWSFILASSPEF